jgi:putative FmdB family regulatory protein
VPVYVYRRLDGSTFETQQRMAEDALVACPTTGQSVERVLQLFTPRYKGTGFYSTDHRPPNGNRQPSEPAAQRPVERLVEERQGRGMTDRAP